MVRKKFMKISKFIKLYEHKLSILDIKKSCQDRKFYLKKKNFFSVPFNYHFINFFLDSDNKINDKRDILLQKGIEFIIDNQNKNGSYDEWYKNEDSFCTSSYTAYLIAKLYLTKKFDLNDILKKKILLSLSKSDHFLLKRDNFNNLNQQFAKLGFQLIHGNQKMKNLKSSYQNIQNNFEYNGLDLGYLTVNLAILADLIILKKDKLLIDLFLKQFQKLRVATRNLTYFPNYIFSRSSRIFLYSGIYFGYKIGLIPGKSILKVQKKIFKEIDYLISKKNFKYLSFFYSSDLQILKKIEDSKVIINNRNRYNNHNELSNDIFTFKNKKYIFLFYKKNPNIFLIYQNNHYSYFFDYNINLNYSKLVPSSNVIIKLTKNKLFIKNDFKKIYNLSLILKANKIINNLNGIIKIGSFIKFLGQNVLIKGLKKKNLRNYKEIIFGKKIIVKEKIIIRKNFFFKTFQVLKNNKQLYFSPTSYIRPHEVGKVKIINKNIKIKSKFKIISIQYECN